MTAVPRPCIDCATLTLDGSDRCPEHEAEAKARRRDRATRRAPGGAYTAARKAYRSAPASFTCAQCGARGVPLEVDHIRPLADGGSDYPSNIQLLCVQHHREKTSAEARKRGAIAPYFAPGPPAEY